MREILFRGKRIDNGEWVNGGCKCEKIGDYLTSVSISESLGHGVWNVHRVDPNTVGQFTGLTDKKGKKIFEGDIVLYMNKETMVVVWNNDSASFAIAYSSINFNYLATISSAHIYLEVIGNIHDNPELLGGAEDGNSERV